MTDHDHDGSCSWTLRIVNGRLVRELVCDWCGERLGTVITRELYTVNPRLEKVAA